jgi:hypothetical protein
MKTALTVALGLCLFFAGSSAVQAQQPSYTNPTVTPWLNLNRFGASPALNYYNLVKPQMNFQAGIGQLQQQNRMDQQSISNLQNGTGAFVTGHQAGFMTQGSYFQTLSGGGGSGAGFGTSGRAGGTQGASGAGSSTSGRSSAVTPTSH